MDYNDLSDKQKEQAKACTTAEELVALAKAEGYDLTDEELEAISGGNSKWACSPHTCDPHT